MASGDLTAKYTGLLPKRSVAVQHTDSRSDEEIIHAISNPPPITSEKNVWAFWDSGIVNMRKWSQRNVIGWVRLLGPSWTVRILDRVEGSPAHYLNFVDRANLPACLVNDTMTGKFTGQHSSDMIRLPCLYQHGGVWLDVGIMLFMHLDDVCWTALTAPQSKHEVALASADPSLMSGLAENFFVASRKSNRFVHRWLRIFLTAWSNRTTCTDIHKHALFRPLLKDNNIARFFQLASEDALDYFGAYLAYERLRLLEDPTDGFNGPQYCKTKVLLIEYREFASAAMQTHNDGPKQFEYLTTRVDQDEISEGFKDAGRFVEYMLSETAMMKLYHWKEETDTVPTLADLWDQKGNEGSDCQEGTFGEFIRWVSSRYKQERKIGVVKFPVLKEKVIVSGLLDEDDDEDEDDKEDY